MFELIKKDHPKKTLKQFSMTIDKEDYDKLSTLAVERGVKLHGFIKSILLGYINYSKEKK